MVTRKKPAPSRARGGSAVVTEGAAHAALRRGPAEELSPEEDHLMRMRLGASPPRSTPLERAAEGHPDLEIEVQAAEIEAYMRWRAREGRADAKVPPARALPSRTKEKIVRALRKKG